jgi:exopolysaccharide biosynthesis polyprenyl glycosylphosphotransferase
MSSFDRRGMARAEILSETDVGHERASKPALTLVQDRVDAGAQASPLSLTDPVICAALMAVDAALMFLGSLASWFIYHRFSGSQLENWRFYALTSAIFAAIFVANGLRSRVYGFFGGIEKPEGMVVHWAETYSRATLILQFAVCGTLILALRSAQYRLLQVGALRERLVSTRVMLVGDPQTIDDTMALWRENDEILHVVKTFPMWRGPSGYVEDLAHFAERVTNESRALRPDRILVLLPIDQRPTIDLLVERFAELPVSILVSTESLVAMHGKPSMLTFGGLRMLRVVRKPLSAADRIIKRSFDLAASAGLLILLLPVFAVVAAAIKLDSAGPAFFIQWRKGFNQRQFPMFKFRTMQWAEDDGSFTQTSRGDPRITRVGKWLRRLNIDELPQLANVLRGEMSLVGPRPHAVEHDDMYYAEIATYARRHNMKPGITGLAQARGHRGATDSLQQMEDRVRSDLAYIEDWSLLLDVKILLLTVFSPRAYRNAY